MSLRLSLLTLVAFGACAQADPSASTGASVQPLDAPAGVGSGEPFLSTAEDAVTLSWLEAVPGGASELEVARLTRDGWGPAHTVTAGPDLLVNWADFPSVIVGGDGGLWAHWLSRRPGPGFAYDIRLATSDDDGATWSDAWTPHQDGTDTEHGFVSLFPDGDGVGLVWLDGRAFAAGPDGTPPTEEMTLRHRTADRSGPTAPDQLLDARTCDCCQTDAARTADGVVVVYRDRSAAGIRDVHAMRRVDGRWTEGTPVHEDGWAIDGCPVNGPAVDARGDAVSVAWFTGANDRPRVYLAFSADGGASFGEPVRVDDGDPSGRVDVRRLSDGSTVVSWLERDDRGGAELRLASFGADGRRGGAVSIATSTSERASGFPRMVVSPWSPREVVLAWTDVSVADRPQVRLARVEVPST